MHAQKHIMAIKKIARQTCIGLLGLACLANFSSSSSGQAYGPDISIKLREPEKSLEGEEYNKDKLSWIFEDNLNRHYLRKFGLSYSANVNPDRMAKDFLKVAKGAVRDWAETTDAYFILKNNAEDWLNGIFSFRNKKIKVGLGAAKEEEIYDEIADRGHLTHASEFYKTRLGIGTNPYIGFRIGNDLIHLRFRYDEFKAEMRKDLLHGLEFRAGAGADYDGLGEIKFFARIQRRFSNDSGLFSLGFSGGKREESKNDGRAFGSLERVEKMEVQAGAFLAYRF